MVKSSVDAAVEQAVLRGDVNQLKFLLDNVANVSKPQARRLIQRCKINKKKIKEGTLDVKDAEKRFFNSLQIAEDIREGKPAPRTPAGKLAEFFRGISRLFGE